MENRDFFNLIFYLDPDQIKKKIVRDMSKCQMSRSLGSYQNNVRTTINVTDIIPDADNVVPVFNIKKVSGTGSRR